jgi:hypothetical protein
VLDTTAPSISDVSLENGISSSISASREVTLKVTAADRNNNISDAGTVCITSSSTGCTDDNDYVPFTSGGLFSHTLAERTDQGSSTGDGVRTAYVAVRDGAGNADRDLKRVNVNRPCPILVTSQLPGDPAGFTSSKKVNVAADNSLETCTSFSALQMCLSSKMTTTGGTCKAWKPASETQVLSVSQAGPNPILAFFRLDPETLLARDDSSASVFLDAKAPVMNKAKLAMAAARTAGGGYSLTWNTAGASDGAAGVASGIAGFKVAYWVGVKNSLFKKCVVAGVVVPASSAPSESSEVSGLAFDLTAVSQSVDFALANALPAATTSKLFVRLCAYDVAGKVADGLVLTIPPV